MKYLYNTYEKNDIDFVPDWRKGKIIERNRNDTGYLIEDVCEGDEKKGLHNRIDEDCRL